MEFYDPKVQINAVPAEHQGPWASCCIEQGKPKKTAVLIYLNPSGYVRGENRVSLNFGWACKVHFVLQSSNLKQDFDMFVKLANLDKSEFLTLIYVRYMCQSNCPSCSHGTNGVRKMSL